MHSIWDDLREPLCAYLELGESYTTCDWSRFKRPAVAEFADEDSPVFRKTAEFVRWYLQDGAIRERPLDLDELIAELQALFGYSYELAEWEACFDSRAKLTDADLWPIYVEMNGVSSSASPSSLRQ